ncbi:MAG: SIR2 family NAD-dependent protein deacylase [Planctomycetota bacterium]
METDEIQDAQVFEELVGRIQKGECILFLGAGVNAGPPEDGDSTPPEDIESSPPKDVESTSPEDTGASPPNDSKYVYLKEHRPLFGQELIEKLAAVCKCKKYCPKKRCKDLQRISLCMETTPALGRQRLVKCLAEHLRKGKKPSPILKMLAQLPFQIIVTTNYDGLMGAALQQFGKPPSIHVYDPSDNATALEMDQDPTEEEPLLFKMHGDLDNQDSIVITDEDYIKFVQRMAEKDDMHPVPQYVRYRMKQWPTLFVGYSLIDYNLRLIFRTLRWRVDKSKFPTSFAVDIHPDPLLLRVYQHQKHFICFVAQNIWKFVPHLFEKVKGHEYRE